MNLSVNKTETQPETTDKKPDTKNFDLKRAPISFPRVGIVGAGLMGEWHARAASKAGGKIVAVVDSDANRANRLAADYPSAQIFADAAKMLAQTSLDVVHICTPTAGHRAIAESVVKAGVNLFIEKPLAQSAEETIFLYDSAAKNNVRICPAHQFIFQTGAEKAKKLLPRAGRTIHLQATICSAGADGLSGEHLNSIAADILPHPLSLFQFFTDETLSTENWRIYRPQSGEMRIFGSLRETSLSIFVSMNSRPAINSFQIFGANGTIHLDLFHGFAFMETGRVSRTRKILRPFDFSIKALSAAAVNLTRRAVLYETAYPGLRQLIQRFYQSLRENGEPPISSQQVINIAVIRDFLTRNDTI